MLPPNKTTARYTATDVANLTADDLSLISPLAFSKIPAGAIPAISTTVIGYLPVTHVSALTSAQLKAIPANLLGYFDVSQVAALTGPQLAALSPNQLREMLVDTNSYTGLENVQAITPAEIKALTPAQIAGLAEYGLISNFSSEQIQALTPTQLKSINTWQLNKLDVSQVAALTGPQLAALSPTQLREMLVDTNSYTELENVRAITPAEIKALTPAQIAGLAEYGINKNFSIEQIKALTPTQVASLTDTFFDTLSDAQFASFSATQFSATNSLKLATLLADTKDILSDAQEGVLGNITAGNTVIKLALPTSSESVKFDIADGNGVDTLDASIFKTAVLLNLKDGESSLFGGNTLTIEKGNVIENAIGGSGNDVLIGNSANNVLTGGLGNDVFVASKGVDKVIGGDGFDTLQINAAVNLGANGLTISKAAPGLVVLTDAAGAVQLQIAKGLAGYTVTGKDVDLAIGTTHVGNDVEGVTIIGVGSGQYMELASLF